MDMHNSNEKRARSLSVVFIVFATLVTGLIVTGFASISGIPMIGPGVEVLLIPTVITGSYLALFSGWFSRKSTVEPAPVPVRVED